MFGRRWHQRLAIAAGVFLFLISLTGVLLHLDMIRVGQHPPGHGGEGGGPPPPAPNIPDDAALAVMVQKLAAAARAEPGIPVKSLAIELAGPRVVLVAGAGGPPGSPQIKLDAATGERIVEPPPPMDFHYILQDLHAGYYFGWTGRILSMLCGLAMLVLSVTGLQMWWKLRRPHRR